MKRTKPLIHPRAVVWRISESSPMGEWVDVGAPAAPRMPSKDLPEVTYGSWVTSSYDLLNGVEVVEGTDTVPGDLLDELFAPADKTKLKRPDR